MTDAAALLVGGDCDLPDQVVDDLRLGGDVGEEGGGTLAEGGALGAALGGLQDLGLRGTRGLGAFGGKGADFGGDDRESGSRFPGARGLDGGVQGEDVRLE